MAFARYISAVAELLVVFIIVRSMLCMLYGLHVYLSYICVGAVGCIGLMIFVW